MPTSSNQRRVPVPRDSGVTQVRLSVIICVQTADHFVVQDRVVSQALMTELIGEPIVSLTSPQGHQRERISEIRREEIADVAGSEVVSLCGLSVREDSGLP